MSRLEKSFRIFSKQGVKFLMLEFLIVFLGVYLAFLFQSYSEQKRIDAEKQKIMIGLKEDLEYFRIYFPDFAGTSQVEDGESRSRMNDIQTFQHGGLYNLNTTTSQ